jgi:hypothetical protein
MILNMIHQDRIIEKYSFEGIHDPIEKLRFIAANRLQEFHYHRAGKGSTYIYIGGFKILMSDHENTSSKYSEPDINVVKRKLNHDDVKIVEEKIDFPDYCKQKVFSMYVGLTIPKLKKLLPETCYEKILENEYYCNTYTNVIKVKPALEYLESQNLVERTPIRQETESYEDYAGDSHLYW